LSDRRRSLAVFPGSFDPITNGHLDIIARSLTVFDAVTVAILVNPEKQPLFTVEERVEIIGETHQGDPRVKVETFTGLLVDYAERAGATVIVRGLRAISDFEAEGQLAHNNRVLAPDVDTVFFMTSVEFGYVSSSLVKEIAGFGGDVSTMVPPAAMTAIRTLARSPERPR